MEGVAEAVVDELPDYAMKANLFEIFNALSYQVTLGAPVILYAKSLGASALILGLINALMPLLTIVQLPATPYIPRFGYRKFIIAGWGGRSIAVFGLAIVPWLIAASQSFKLALVFALLFAFNFIRGIASGVWWPWISEIIPHQHRARFIARDQIAVQLGSFISMLIAAWILHGKASPWQFSLVFFISGTAQIISVLYLAAMPDVTAPHRVEQTSRHVPWKEILFWPPFARMMVFNFFYQFAVAGITVFTIAWLRGVAHYTDSRVIIFSSVSFLGALFTIRSIGRWLAISGSITVLRTCLLAFLLILLGWFGASSSVIPHTPVIIGCLFLLQGIATANFTVSNWRYAMDTIPPMGRNHFFAMYIVLTNLAAGTSPIVWGALIDFFAQTTHTLGHFDLNRYSIYFACATIVCVMTMFCSTLLREPAKR